MSGVEVSIKLSPKQAGKLYMQSEQQKEEIARLRAALERIAAYPQTRDDELGYVGCRKVARAALST